MRLIACICRTSRGMNEANGSMSDWGTFVAANALLVAGCLLVLFGIAAYRHSQMPTPPASSSRPARSASVYKG